MSDGGTRGGYTALVRYTLAGFVFALLLGLGLDWLHLQRNGIAGWAVRVLSGQGESLCEGFFAARRRWLGQAPSMAEAYGWGKVLGMIAPWIIDAGSRFLRIDVSGIGGFYIPWLYGMADQLGANVGGFWFICRRSRSLRSALRQYLAEPVMLTSLMVIPLGAVTPLATRLAGLLPHSQVVAALETGLANLSWLPPVVGWLVERRSSRLGQSRQGAD